MNWEAANAPKARETSSNKPVGGSSETVEAALSRLSKAYSTSMECIGSCARINKISIKEKKDRKSVLKRVSNAARNTLETAILMDPLVVIHAPTLCQEFSLSGKGQEKRPPPPIVNSAAHKATIRELAYLSLVNYSDLLQSCCSFDSLAGPERVPSHLSILDVGVVKKLESLTNQTADATSNDNNEYNWQGESQHETQLLSLSALCDASNLDGSDPILWLKLASAARRLERASIQSVVQRSKYRRLEQYALERGSTALPPTVPPNRTIAKALIEFMEEEEILTKESYETHASELSEFSKVIVDLPRYSWSILGRMLVRACREGSDFQSHHFHNRRHAPSGQAFGSPTLILKLNPMFILPPNLLGMMCEFLDPISVIKFESTCRGIAFSMIAAKASTQKVQNKPTLSKPKPGDNDTKEQEKEALQEKEVDKNASAALSTENPNSSSPQKKDEKASSSRASKRLRSQLITSGKISERLAHRKSFDYCFLGACNQTTKPQFALLLKEAHAEASKESAAAKQKQLLSEPTASRNNTSSTEEARLDVSSLSSFVELWSGSNSGPLDVLRQFLLHIAKHIEQVVPCDPRGPLELTSCILTALELYHRSCPSNQLVPQWFQPPEDSNFAKNSLDLFAADLLYAELVLKQCDRYAPTHVEFDDDGNVLTLMVTALLEARNSLNPYLTDKSSHPPSLKEHFMKLSIRCYWLAAGFYLWRSRISRVIVESRLAEEEGIFYIDETAKWFPLLSGSCKAIKTPHLVSPGRTESHWKEISPTLLAKFRNEIQASSVVSLAKEKFQELAGGIVDTASGTISDKDTQAFVDVGESLLERYKSSHGDAGAKHDELVDDFLLVHGEDLVSLLSNPSFSRVEEDRDENAKESILDPVPLETVSLATLLRMTNPSILSILVTCLNMSKNHRLNVTQLMIRLVLTTIDIHGSLLERFAQTKANRGDDDNFSDDSDDESVMSDDGSVDRNSANKNAEERRLRDCGRLVIYFLDRIHILLAEQDGMTDDERTQLLMSDDCIVMIQASMQFAADWFHTTERRRAASDDNIDQRLFQTIRLVVGDLCGASESRQICIKQFFFVGMAKTIISQRPMFLSLVKAQSNRGGRAARQKLCIKRAEFLGSIFSEIGYILSEHIGHVKDLFLMESVLFKNSSPELMSSATLSNAEITMFFDSIIGIWKYSSMALTEDAAPDEYSAVCSSFDRPIVRRLQIPMATAIVGLCGSATQTRRKESAVPKSSSNCTDPLCLTEFFDSDASANEWLSDHEDLSTPEGSENEIKARKKELVRAICHAVHCINIVVGRVQNNKGAVSNFSDMKVRDDLGPLLPIVATRVLNFFADSLLLNFGPVEATNSNQNENLWVQEFPVTTQMTGEILDSLLRKSYKWLHGFTLVDEKTHQSTGKDDIVTSTASDSSSKVFEPESTLAAARLYRCIVRAYASGRRSPPKAALEVVLSALPPLEESEKSTSLREFMFSAKSTCFSFEEVSQLMKKGEGWKSSFEKIENHLVAPTLSQASTDGSSALASDIMRIRRGISTQMASGQIPMTNSESGKKSDSGQDDDRVLSVKHEEELAKKFFAIVDDLCLGDAGNSGGWLRAAQCLSAKSELIADRLGLSQGFARSNDFAIPTPRPQRKHKTDITELEAEQERNDSLLSEKWIQHIGNDLSVYVQHSWSSFSSLVDCASQIANQLDKRMDTDGNDERSKSTETMVLKKVQSMHQTGDFLKWQESWGGLFVRVLRDLSLRFTCGAIFILQSKEKLQAEDRILMAEILEMIGVFFYTELMASQNYGFPMHTMAQKRKRDLATASKAYFQRAIEIVEEHNSEEQDDSSENRETWDLIFMCGKCDEKIAGTYRHESFGDAGSPRKYEQHMAMAMQSYSSALKQAESIESDGGLTVGQQGGSSHGSTEILYRLAASRLKYLISAVSQNEDDLEKAEAEALRLTDIYWFKKAEVTEEMSIDNSNIRDRVWAVLTDIVTGLAQCRQDHHFFHRSVYRHAQALMWAPIINDPNSNDGSLGMVPATRSCQIRGLNNSTHAANSAEVVMSTLFDKKRPQLCAVWLTVSASSSPFQVINNSNRKYDSLRGKYVAAYIESLRLCGRRSELEQFLKQISSSKRDVASFFQVSALSGGTFAPKSHTNDTLLKVDDSLQSSGFLVSAKREANSAFADILLKEFSRGGDSTPDKLKKGAENNLKHAYACYLRLHCTENDLKKSKALKYGVGSIREVELLCQAYLNTDYAKQSTVQVNDWSGGARKSTIYQNALEKCKSMYPSLSGNFLFKSFKNNKSKDKDTASSGNKRKSQAQESKKSKKLSFEVSVPSHLYAGDTFLTTVKVGEETTKKVKLTVPEGSPSTLRFTLKV